MTNTKQAIDAFEQLFQYPDTSMRTNIKQLNSVFPDWSNTIIAALKTQEKMDNVKQIEKLIEKIMADTDLSRQQCMDALERIEEMVKERIDAMAECY
jgi:hypothetical protein